MSGRLPFRNDILGEQPRSAGSACVVVVVVTTRQAREALTLRAKAARR